MIGSLFLMMFLLADARANLPQIELTLKSAEERAVRLSHKLKAASTDREAAHSLVASQLSLLFPKLSLLGTYQYNAQIPQVQFFTTAPPVPFGINHSFSFGPSLTYTLWDTFAAANSYRAATSQADAKEADFGNSTLQLLLSTRLSYIQVDLAVEELRLIHDSLKLASSQYKDVENRFKVGVAASLDLATAKRSVLNYQMQFQQRQADLSVLLKDLLALVGEPNPNGISHPGTAEIEDVKLILKLDSFKDLLRSERKAKILEPDDTQPQIRAKTLEVAALRYQASSQAGKLWPVLQVGGSVTYNQPNIPTAVGASPLQYWQESIAASFSMPLYLGDPTRGQVAAFRAQALAAEERLSQLKLDLKTGFEKSKDLLESLYQRSQLAEMDLAQSEEVAKLYYTSYKVGKVNLTDVQNANVQALQAKMNAARIDAQILTQIMQMKAISGKELPGEDL